MIAFISLVSLAATPDKICNRLKVFTGYFPGIVTSSARFMDSVLFEKKFPEVDFASWLELQQARGKRRFQLEGASIKIAKRTWVRSLEAGDEVNLNPALLPGFEHRESSTIRGTILDSHAEDLALSFASSAGAKAVHHCSFIQADKAINPTDERILLYMLEKQTLEKLRTNLQIMKQEPQMSQSYGLANSISLLLDYTGIESQIKPINGGRFHRVVLEADSEKFFSTQEFGDPEFDLGEKGFIHLVYLYGFPL